MLHRKIHALNLSDEIITTIFSFLSAQDAWGLLGVSKKIQSFAGKRAIASVVLVKRRQTARFCAFMRADLATRARWLRDLEVRSGAFGIQGHLRETTDLSQINALAEIITQAANLQRIQIPCIEYLLIMRPCIGKALQASPRLTEVGLLDAGSRALELVGRMRSRPRKLVFSRLTYVDTPTPLSTTSSADQSVDVSLSNLRGILTGQPPHPRWPNVRRLSLKDSVASMSACALLFPNLQELRLENVHNEFQQCTPVACWNTLRRVSGYPRDFEQWRITASVQCWKALEAENTTTHAFSVR